MHARCVSPTPPNLTRAEARPLFTTEPCNLVRRRRAGDATPAAAAGPRRCPAALLIALAGLLLAPSLAASQSISRGALHGTVRDTAGAPFAGARVQIRDMVSGVSWWVHTGLDGRFRQPLLQPGDYEVFVEDIGYQPQSVSPVPVRPGRSESVSITLRPAQLPVQNVERVPHEATTDPSRAGMAEWYGTFEVHHLPEGRREIAELGRLSPRSDADLNIEGLPGSLSGIFLDGLPVPGARHPDLPPSRLNTPTYPLGNLKAAELLTNGVDVEWTGFAGGYLSGYTRRGKAMHDVRAYGDWTGGDLISSDHFEIGDDGANTFRAGVMFTGPIVEDTAHYVVGFEAMRLETPFPDAWVLDSLNVGLIEVADSAELDIRPYTETRLTATDIISGFGNFDWQITQNHQISLRAEGGWFERGGESDRYPNLGPGVVSSLGAKVEGYDFSAGATLASRLKRWLTSELRVGLNRTDRDFNTAAPPTTRIVDGGLAFGIDPTLPAQLERLTINVSETLNLTLGRHLLKIGFGTRFDSNSQRYAYGRDGIFTFAGLDEFRQGEGVFSIAGGTARMAEFDNWQWSVYLQDTWAAAPGLELTGGIRYDKENLDDGAVPLNTDWEDVSGLRNNSFDDDFGKFSPRFGFLWNISERNSWLVRGSAGLYNGVVDPGLFGQLVTLSGGIVIQRAVGDLGPWPELPGSGVAPAQGPRLALLGPEFKAPRTARASLGITRQFPDGTSVMLSGAYRFTSHLPRPADLNLAQAPATTDQYERPIFGTPVQQGSLVTVEPGSNRRFQGFDFVSAINADGESRYWDASLAVQRQTDEGLNLLAAYTYSWTRDDWLSGGSGGLEQQLDPFPQDGLRGEDWRDGRSDFDRPHRLVVGAELELPRALAGSRIAGLYRFSSGRPFTPAFRAGVDVNGDGSGMNDPAFVDPEIPGMNALLDEWDCLAEMVGDFAERNACRGPSIHFLDASRRSHRLGAR